MPNFPIVLEWKRDFKGYRLEDRGKYGTWVVREGGKLIDTKPLKDSPRLSVLFSKVDTPEKLLQFVRKFGFLDATDPSVGFFKNNELGDLELIDSAPSIAGERVDTYIHLAVVFREIMAQAQRGLRRVPPNLDNALRDILSAKSLGEIRLKGDRRLRILGRSS